MKKLVILLLSIFCVLFVVGCGEPEPLNTYYITFKQNGQQNIIKEVLEGESLTDIPSPTPKTGYIITWDTEDFSNITEDKTVNAIETAKKFTVDYDENGGIEIEKTTEVTYGELFNLETTSRDGYVFAGYEFLGNKITSPVWFYDTQASEVTVKLLWNYQITFSQAGYEDVVVQLAENEQISSEQIPTPKTRTGYQVSWSVQDFSSVTSNTTVTCVETPNKYKIYYDQITAENIPNGVEVLTDSQGRYYFEVTYDAPFDKNTLLTPIVSDQTLVFDYWKGIEEVNQPVWKLAQDITVTPMFRDNTYTWHFVVGEQEAYINLANGQSLAKDYSLIPPLPQTNGYITEWDTKFWEMTSGGGTVFPKVTPIKFKVTFQVGENETAKYSTKEFTYGERYILDNTVTNKDGKVSIGWSYKGEIFPEQAEAWTLLPEDGTVLVDPVTGEHKTVEITLTSIWFYSVTFKSPVGDVVKKVYSNDLITDIPPVYKDENNQYRYEWNYDFTKPITEDTVIELREKIIKVTLITNGGTVSSTYLEVKYGRQYTLPKVRFKNFEFDGWLYNGEEFKMSGIWDVDVDSIVLTAKRGAYFTGNY